MYESSSPMIMGWEEPKSVSGSADRGLCSAVIDATNGYAYFGRYGIFSSGEAAEYLTPGRIDAMRLSDFTWTGTLDLNWGENELLSAVIDTANGFAYFGTISESGYSLGRIIKVALYGGTFDFSLSNSGGIAVGQGGSGSNTITVTHLWNDSNCESFCVWSSFGSDSVIQSRFRESDIRKPIDSNHVFIYAQWLIPDNCNRCRWRSDSHDLIHMFRTRRMACKNAHKYSDCYA